MGTPDFSVASLSAVLEAGHAAAAVFSQPDRPRGRGLRVTPSPVSAFALSRGIPLYRPETFKGGAQDALLQSIAPDCVVVVVYGRILPRAVLGIPPLGCINVHASLLPRYRGAAPIQRAVAQGERETGVTTMYLSPEMDAGDMIYQESTPIGETDDAGTVHDRLMRMGAGLLVKTLADIERGTAPRIPQDHARATFAPKLKREDARIDWTRPAVAVSAFIRGMSPYPGAFCGLLGEGGGETASLKVFFASATGKSALGDPGRVAAVGPGGIEVCCGDGQTVLLTEVQGPGGRRMTAAAYMRGHAKGFARGHAVDYLGGL